MTRATNNPASRRRRKKVLKRASGFQGGRSRLYRTAAETVKRAMAYATRDRKQKKRTFRSLWIARLNAACRAFDVPYSKFIKALKDANIVINRKALSNLAITDEKAFAEIMTLAKQKLA